MTQDTPQAKSLAVKKFVRNVKENAEAMSILRDWGLDVEESGYGVEGLELSDLVMFCYQISHKFSQIW